MLYPIRCFFRPTLLTFLAASVLSAAGAELPNFDKRLDRANQPAARLALVPDKAAAQATTVLQSRVHDLSITRHEILGTPNWVGSTREFLTGRNGEGVAVNPDVVTNIAANETHRGVKTFLTEHQALFGFGPEALASARVRQDSTNVSGSFSTVIWQQQVDDIAVFEAIFKAHLTKRGELINVGSQFVPDLAGVANKLVNRAALKSAPPISVQQALVLAAETIGEKLDATLIEALDKPEGAESFQHFQAANVLNSASARLTWLPLDAANLTLCWEVNLVSHSRGEGFQVLVDAQTGEVWARRCFTEHATTAQYNVFTSESPTPMTPGWATPLTNQPAQISRTLVTLASLSGAASPNGWINDGDNTTAGNNVDAHLDRNNDDVPDVGSRMTGSPFRVFNPALDLNQQPAVNTNAAVVNLFYWNNWMHDQLYAFGFDEASGNFQNERFGKGGFPGTAVQADGQDASVTDSQSAPPNPQYNNANFLVLPDGSAPRMQMYVYNGPTPNRDACFDATILCHEYTHGLSGRLVGGGLGITALQSRGMGEGWSDFYAAALLSSSSMDVNGTYIHAGYSNYKASGTAVANYYFGSRRYPYSTDMTKDPLTFKDIDPAQASAHNGVPLNPLFSNGYFANQADEPHAAGEVWCTMLWEMRARIINRVGFVLGNQETLQIVTDGMKLSPSNPTFMAARNSILEADLADNGGANINDIWTAFAKRGLGVGAADPTSSTNAGVVEDFTPLNQAYGTIDIESPAELGFYTSTPTCAGIANVSGGQIWATLFRFSDGLFYNPTNGTWTANGGVIVAAANSTWSVNLPTLPAGDYSLGIRVLNYPYLSTEFDREFTIDTSTPVASITSPSNNAKLKTPPTVTGTVKDNYWVQDVRVTLERGSDSAWYNFASNTWGTAVFDFNRNIKQATVVMTNWTAVLPSLADGSYQVQMQAVDRAQNATAWATRSFTLDSSAPTVTFSPLANAQTIFDFSQLGGGLSEAGTVKFRLNQYDAGGTNDQYWNGSAWIFDGNSPTVYLNATVTGNTWTPNATLPSRGQLRAGPYFVRAVGTDASGNSATNEILLTRSATDTTAPNASITSITAGQVFTNASLPGLAGTANDPESGIASVDVYLIRFDNPGVSYWTGAGWSTTSTALTGVYSAGGWQVNAALPGGANLINANYQVQAVANNKESPNGSQLVSTSFSVDFHPVFTWTQGSFLDNDPNNNDYNWENPANWDVGSVPTTNAVVIIPSGSPVTVTSKTVYELRLLGGSLNHSGNLLIKKRLIQQGDLYAGSVILPTNTTWTWTGGYAAANYNIQPGASALWSGGGNTAIADGMTIANQGTITWSNSAPIYANGYSAASTISNLPGANFVVIGDGEVFSHINGGYFLVFYNAGLFDKAAGANSILDVCQFYNTGEIQAESGTNTFNGMLQLSPGSRLTGAGRHFIAGGNVTISGTTTVQNASVELAAGNLTGDGNGSATFATTGGGMMTWSGGNLYGTVALATNSQMQISGADYKTFIDSAVLDNHGQITWSGGSLLANGYNDFSYIRNRAGATFTITASATAGHINGGYVGVFDNQPGGSMLVTASGTSSWNAWKLNNAGTVRMNTGILQLGVGGEESGAFTNQGGTEVQFTGGTFNLHAGTKFTGNGTNRVAGGTVKADAYVPAGASNSPGLFVVDSGELGGNGFTVQGQFKWNSGYLSGTISNAVGGTFELHSDGSAVWLDGAVVNNAGTALFTGTGRVLANGYNDFSTWHNFPGGIFNITVDGELFGHINGGYVVVFNNEAGGRLAKLAGTNSTLDVCNIVNGGELRCDSGTLVFNANLTLTNGTTFTGAGQHELAGNTVALNGTAVVKTTLNLSGANLIGVTAASAITTTNGGLFQWSGGSLQGQLTLTAGSLLQFIGTDAKEFTDSAVFNNAGTAQVVGSGLITVNGYSDFSYWNNLSGAHFDILSDGSVFSRINGSFTMLFNNNSGARLDKINGATSILALCQLNNSGELRCDSGLLQYSATLTLNAGGTFTGTGSHEITGGTVTWNGSSTVFGTTLKMSDGQLTGGPGATIVTSGGTGLFNWAGGTFYNTMSFAAGGQVRLTSPAAKTLADGAVLNNAGTLTFAGNGTLVANAYSDNSTISNLAGGTIVISSNAVCSRVNGNQRGFLYNGGTVAMDAAPRTFALDWDYVQSAAGTLKVQLAGAAPGTGYSKLSANNVTLAGNFTASLGAGFTPATSNSFDVVTYGADSGQFTALSLASLPAGKGWLSSYGANAFTLSISQPPSLGGSTVTNGHFRFLLTGPAGSSAVLEGSTNLSSWAPLLTNSPFTGNFDFTDPQTLPKRFYRAKITP